MAAFTTAISALPKDAESDVEALTSLLLDSTAIGALAGPQTAATISVSQDSYSLDKPPLDRASVPDALPSKFLLCPSYISTSPRKLQRIAPVGNKNNISCSRCS